ncbi:ecdysis triggering hormone isoform X1 [Megachile rotundata]|uniref:ecdysis triggering hormone isoform X1 n=1 Tax=Megachile rotundata TaxID=143995 RepID=UPI003FD4A5C6
MVVLRSFASARGLVVGAFLLATLVSIGQNATKADEVPAFFLKIAKNIPRVGRSDGYDGFFKSRQNIPKIGGHDTQSESWPAYANNEPFARPIKRRADYPQLQDAWSWQHFPLAIEGPRELWRTLAGYSKDTSDDIDNEIWERKKRTGNEGMAPAEN